MQLLSNQINAGLMNMNNLMMEPKTIPTPISINNKQPNNNRRYFSALSAADTFNSFNTSHKQSQAQIKFLQNETVPTNHTKKISFKNGRRSTNASQQAGSHVDRVNSRYKNNNTTMNQVINQLNSSAVNRTFNGSVKNNKIPNKKAGNSQAQNQKNSNGKYQNQFSMYMSQAVNPPSAPNKSMINPNLINVMDVSHHMIMDLNNFHTANNSANTNN